MPIVLAVLALSACARAPQTQTRSWEARAPQALTTRFVGQNDAPLSPAQAFSAQGACPKLTTATLTPVRPPTASSPGLARLVLRGDLAAVTRVGALLSDGTLANVEFQRGPDGLTVPVMCRTCEVVLGVPRDGRAVACTGPGFSVQVENGRLTD